MKAINRFYLMAIPVHCIPIEVCVNRVSLLWYPCVSRPPGVFLPVLESPIASTEQYMYCLPYTFARRCRAKVGAHQPPRLPGLVHAHPPALNRSGC